ncbi:MAG TPA: SHOCT domain-containing protein [Candidatus Limnocylindrales bacterium]|nr:SHOCT domain-containing protein [Candidatus Limnocylindrales bacterium]
MEGSMIAAAGLFMAGLVILYAVLVRAAGPRRRLETALGLEALSARRASGEITAEEFEQGRRLLGG